MNIDFSKEIFFNLCKMLKASEEDRNLALETIKNLNLPEFYHSLFIKDLVFTDRHKYTTFFELGFKPKDFTLTEIYKSIKSSKDPVAKEIFESIAIEVVNSGYNRFDFMTVKIKIEW